MAISRAFDSSIQDGLPRFNNVWDGTTATSAFDVINHVTLSAAQSTIEFNNIPATYTHLQIRATVRSNYSAANMGFTVQFNSDTATNYSYHLLQSSGSAMTSSSGTTQSSISGFNHPAASGTTSLNKTRPAVVWIIL